MRLSLSEGKGIDIPVLKQDSVFHADNVCRNHRRCNIRLLARLLGASSSPPRRQQAILAYSALLGAIALSRAVSDRPLSTEILASVKELLVKGQSRGPQKKTAKTADAVLTRHPRRATKRNQEKT